ncbi:transposase [Oceanobacillus halophilus]|uniref:Transposase n=1 Tax=Oceanobacillus halophilus TaxID=930130 RepID=A0A495A3Y9_9BACI|nr:transposase [Oceanobacillus halophilus]RKQ34268.1 transposase [Oceanobacillus halophilus]
MARKLRVWYPGAMFHITSRGNRRAAIFYDENDQRAYFDILEQARIYYPFHLHAYCLMTNHIHLQLETINHHPKDIMKMLNSRYALYFNKRHRLVGHVFQGRYGAELIETIDYELEVSRYIHLNPLEAEMVNKPEEYRWSSYRAYVLGEENPHVRTERILGHFKEPREVGYRRFVEGEV